ncbi:putative neuraminidase [Nocardia transvalensis]|uniref:Putative neuraminidase n=1 Tax=Nocardia transvalensis TaxID=37333 RepID=A0A7W9PD16_9NOCA|nr:hypothetical protein [Nocardia transvalensis]MBB5913927.1 putative neuraminidase [Nocardia transvalensis]
MRLDSNDYSVHPSVIGRNMDVGTDLNEVAITCGGAEVGRYRRCWAAHQTPSGPGHVAAAKDLRRSRLLAAVPVLDTGVEQRDLSTYDRLLNLDSEGIV